MLSGAFPLSLCLVRPDGACQFVSPNVAELLGWDPRVLVGRPLAEWLHPEDSLRWVALLQQVNVNPGCLAHQWIRLRHQSGGYVPVEIQAWRLPLVGSHSALLLLIPHVQQECPPPQELVQSQRFFRKVLDTAPGYAYVFHLTERRFLFVSEGSRRVLGFSPEECMAMGAGIMDRCHPDDIPAVRTILYSLRNAADGTVVSFDFRMQRRDGAWRWLHSQATIFERGPDGAVVAVVGTTQDVTEQRELEDRLRHHQELLERTRDELRRLTHRLMRQEEELGRIVARELHDDITQRLTGLNLELARMIRSQTPPTSTELEGLQEEIRQLSDALRNLAYRLHPSILDELGLKTALELECREYSRRARLTIDFLAEDVPDEVPEPIALCLYRVTQEALRNATRHGRPQTILVRLARKRRRLLLQIFDDGIGFDPTSESFRRGLGLISMEERVRLVGGRLWIRSRPGEGTLLQVLVPIDKERTCERLES